MAPSRTGLSQSVTPAVTRSARMLRRVRLIDLARSAACASRAERGPARAEPLCGTCRRTRALARRPMAADGVWAPVAYAGPARDVVAALKFRGATRGGRRDGRRGRARRRRPAGSTTGTALVPGAAPPGAPPQARLQPGRAAGVARSRAARACPWRTASSARARARRRWGAAGRERLAAHRRRGHRARGRRRPASCWSTTWSRPARPWPPARRRCSRRAPRTSARSPTRGRPGASSRLPAVRHVRRHAPSPIRTALSFRSPRQPAYLLDPPPRAITIPSPTRQGGPDADRCEGSQLRRL